MAPRPCVIDLAIGLLVVMAVFVVQSSGACDRETIRGEFYQFVLCCIQL